MFRNCTDELGNVVPPTYPLLEKEDPLIIAARYDNTSHKLTTGPTENRWRPGSRSARGGIASMLIQDTLVAYGMRRDFGHEASVTVVVGDSPMHKNVLACSGGHSTQELR